MVALPLVPRAVPAAREHPMRFTWAGYDVPEMHKEDIDKHGESPLFTLFGDEESAEAKMVAGFKPDVAVPCSYKIRKWNDFGFLKPIDAGRLGAPPAVVGRSPNRPRVGDRVAKRRWRGLQEAEQLGSCGSRAMPPPCRPRAGLHPSPQSPRVIFATASRRNR